MSNDIVERWRGFVQKVTGRLTEIMNESNGGFEGLLQDPGLDPITFMNAMNAIELRYKDLRTKLATTYSEQVVLPTLGGGREAKQLLDEAENWFEDTWQRFRTGWNGRLVRTLYQRVGPLMNKPAMCSRCGSQLTRTLMHQAESITCASCKAVNSVSPDPLVYTYFTIAPDMIADEQTAHMKIAVERAQHAGAGHAQTDALWQQYFETYAKARATIAPMTADEVRSYAESRMKMLRMYR